MEAPVTNSPEKEDYFKQVKELCRVKGVKGHNLVRIGEKYDGGYVMLDDFIDKNIVYSFGIGNNISWDKGMADRGTTVYCFDPTIKELPEEYQGLEFFKIGITGKDDEKNRLYSMRRILEYCGHERESYMILKMDVEGAEWDFLEEATSEILSKFSQLTFELHDVSDMKNEKKIINGLKKLQETHTPIWIHANNNGGSEIAGNYQIPKLLEITYVNKNQYELVDIEYNCPISLDTPNVDCFLEIELKQWGNKG